MFVVRWESDGHLHYAAFPHKRHADNVLQHIKLDEGSDGVSFPQMFQVDGVADAAKAVEAVKRRSMNVTLIDEDPTTD
jgi:hypothetical protein